MFKQQKTRQLSKIDKSSIGEWDSKIKGLCEGINKNPKYYTTSSCAGRILLIKGVDKKVRDVFLFRTHKKTNFNELKKALKKIDYNKLVEFQLSTCILHVACADLISAQGLVNKAKLSGWKHSGSWSRQYALLKSIGCLQCQHRRLNSRQGYRGLWELRGQWNAVRGHSQEPLIHTDRSSWNPGILKDV